MREEKKLNVYNETVDEIYKRFETNREGLSEEEAQKRLLVKYRKKLVRQKRLSKKKLPTGKKTYRMTSKKIKF